MNSVPVGAAATLLPDARVLQQNATPAGPGGSDRVGAPDSSFVARRPSESATNGKAHSCLPVQVGLVAAGRVVPAEDSDAPGVTRQGLAAGSGRTGLLRSVGRGCRRRLGPEEARWAGMQSLRGRFHSGWAVRRNGRRCTVQSRPFPKLNRGRFGVPAGDPGSEFVDAPCRVYCTDCIVALALWGVNDVWPGPAFPGVMRRCRSGGCSRCLAVGGGKAGVCPNAPGSRGWTGIPGDKTPEGGLAHHPLRGTGFSLSSATLGTCTGIGTWTASVNGRGFVAEMGGNPPFQRGFCEHLDSSAGSGGRMHRPYWRGAFFGRAGPDRRCNGPS